ncbi:hypothetical protein M0804_004650 [Polistes exclamans]|nr:hypothetical protein M0804_004650 [Polistes exclamans]
MVGKREQKSTELSMGGETSAKGALEFLKGALYLPVTCELLNSSEAATALTALHCTTTITTRRQTGNSRKEANNLSSTWLVTFLKNLSLGRIENANRKDENPIVSKASFDERRLTEEEMYDTRGYNREA